MSESFFIRPACPGAMIIDPDTRDALPDSGAVKPRNAYWLALQTRGDVVEADAPAEARADVPDGNQEPPTDAPASRRKAANPSASLETTEN